LTSNIIALFFVEYTNLDFVKDTINSQGLNWL